MTMHNDAPIVAAPLTTITPAEVCGLVERLRAFAEGCRGSMWQSRDETINLMDEAAAALAAKDAELAIIRGELNDCASEIHDLRAQIERAEAQLAEARKALGALDRMSRGVDWCDQDEQARRWEAARRALEAQGGENGQ